MRVFRPSDPLFQWQWHLENTGQGGGGVGIDLDVLRVWPDYTGRGVRVGVVDNGTELDHPDLVANLDLGASWDAALDRPGGGPTSDRNGDHGTAVAGIIGAAWNNGLGGVGIAPEATLVAYRIALDDEAADGTKAEIAYRKALADGADILNNSWGTDFPFAWDWDIEEEPIRDALIDLVTQGRGGLGSIVLFANGNARTSLADGNFENITSNRFVAAVAAVDSNGIVSSYSTPGANLLVSGLAGASSSQHADRPGTGIITTDRAGHLGYNTQDSPRGDYAHGFNGTSAATPTVSGVTALVLEANPGLGYRDVHEILAYSARVTDASAMRWTTTHAGDWNGGGLQYSRDYGFGLVDAHAAVRLAETYRYLHPVARDERNIDSAAAELVPGTPMAIGESLEVELDFLAPLRANRIELDLGLEAPNPSLLRATLISPSGTEIVMFNRPGITLNVVNDGPVPTIEPVPWPTSFVLGTPAFWGEAAEGTWRLRIEDVTPEQTAGASFLGAEVTVWGEATPDARIHVFTDDFAAFATQAPGRLTVGDAAQDNVINAAAVSSAMLIDLAGEAPSLIDGQAVTLAAGARFTAAYAGDGDDTLRGDDGDNVFLGGRGSDMIDGQGGVDTALFLGSRADYRVGWDGGTMLVQDNARDGGLDQLLSIERLAFDEGTLVARAATDLALAVAGLYGGLLERLPEAGGFRYWVDSGFDAVGLAHGIAVSEEFALGLGQASVPDFVEAMYRNLLDRDSDAIGLDFWTGQLLAGANRGEIALCFLNSEEFGSGSMASLVEGVASLGDVWVA